MPIFTLLAVSYLYAISTGTCALVVHEPLVAAGPALLSHERNFIPGSASSLATPSPSSGAISQKGMPVYRDMCTLSTASSDPFAPGARSSAPFRPSKSRLWVAQSISSAPTINALFAAGTAVSTLRNAVTPSTVTPYASSEASGTTPFSVSIPAIPLRSSRVGNGHPFLIERATRQSSEAPSPGVFTTPVTSASSSTTGGRVTSDITFAAAVTTIKNGGKAQSTATNPPPPSYSSSSTSTPHITTTSKLPTTTLASSPSFVTPAPKSTHVTPTTTPFFGHSFTVSTADGGLPISTFVSPFDSSSAKQLGRTSSSRSPTSVDISSSLSASLPADKNPPSLFSDAPFNLTATSSGTVTFTPSVPPTSGTLASSLTPTVTNSLVGSGPSLTPPTPPPVISTQTIAGIALGITVLLVILAGFLVYFCRRSNRCRCCIIPRRRPVITTPTPFELPSDLFWPADPEKALKPRGLQGPARVDASAAPAPEPSTRGDHVSKQWRSSRQGIRTGITADLNDSRNGAALRALGALALQVPSSWDGHGTNGDGMCPGARGEVGGKAMDDGSGEYGDEFVAIAL